MFFVKWWWKKEPSEWECWFATQIDALNRGEEIVPPWIAFPDSDPWWGGWRQGNSQGWLVLVWIPFWRHLNDREKLAYIEKWDASADWREYLMKEKSVLREPISLAEHVLNLDKFQS